MKSILTKIIISMVAIGIALFVLHFLNQNHQAEEDGFVNVIIENESQEVVFDDMLAFLKGDTFFDVLDRTFTLTCASATYQPDATCSHTFGIPVQGKILLGVQSESFVIITDWTHTFLAFEIFEGTSFHFASQGVSQLPFKDGDIIKISVRIS
ncbi:MAG: hypothetical protein IH571_03460 [Acholeplasmataceae bacterium]|nr:hypothetical protein [Acholeplasmataceae bacterium]